MITIVPNWHPMLVHFPVALTLAAALFGLAAALAGQRPLAAQWVAISRWLLWLAALSGLAAAAAGMSAFATVDHDEAGHVAMLRHRDAALASLGVLLVLALREAYCAMRGRAWTWLSVLLLAGASVALARTAWLGGELVYRHGIGVLPRLAPVVPAPPPAATAVPAGIAPAVPAASDAAAAAKAAPAHEHKHPEHKHAH